MTIRRGSTGYKIEQTFTIFKDIQNLSSERILIHVVACKGTDRTIAPPKTLFKGEAPFRRSLIKHRHTGAIMIEDAWEEWETLSNRQVIRKAPARVNITVFAANPPCENISHSPTVSHSEESKTVVSNPAQVDVEAQRVPKPSDVPESEDQLTMRMQTDLSSTQHGPQFLALSLSGKAFFMKIHANLGHPRPQN